MLWVVSHVPGWLGVITPDAANDRVGWIAQNATALSRVSWELKVSLAARRLTVLRYGKVVVQYTVAIGAAGSPTPTGRFAVTDRIVTNDPAGPYGCCILALSAHAPHALQGWVGGTRIAIHSTPESASIGEATSHGCVHVTLPEGRWLLAHIPIGTPTLINST
jgi:lipoprotein-anchoring transpeptidase ErfK/SrfK